MKQPELTEEFISKLKPYAGTKIIWQFEYQISFDNMTIMARSWVFLNKFFRIKFQKGVDQEVASYNTYKSYSHPKINRKYYKDLIGVKDKIL